VKWMGQGSDRARAGGLRPLQPRVKLGCWREWQGLGRQMSRVIWRFGATGTARFDYFLIHNVAGRCAFLSYAQAAAIWQAIDKNKTAETHARQFGKLYWQFGKFLQKENSRKHARHDCVCNVDLSRRDKQRHTHCTKHAHTRYTRLINSIRTAVGFGIRCRGGGLQDRFRA
jgi:hypothetical protein